MDDYLLKRGGGEIPEGFIFISIHILVLLFIRIHNKFDNLLNLHLGTYVCLFTNLLRHVSILYARVEKLEVAGKEIPPRQVMCTATDLRKSQSVSDTCTVTGKLLVYC